MASPVTRVGEDGSSIWQFGGGSPPPLEFNDYFMAIERETNWLPSSLYLEKDLRADPEKDPAHRCTESYIGGGYVLEAGISSEFGSIYHLSNPLETISSFNIYHWVSAQIDVAGCNAIYVEEENKIYMHFWYTEWVPDASMPEARLLIVHATPGLEDHTALPVCVPDELVMSQQIRLEQMSDVHIHPSGKLSGVWFSYYRAGQVYTVVLAGGTELVPTGNTTYISVVSSANVNDSGYFNSFSWLNSVQEGHVFFASFIHDSNYTDLVIYSMIPGGTSENISQVTSMIVSADRAAYASPLANLAGGALDKIAFVMYSENASMAAMFHADLTGSNIFNFDLAEKMQVSPIAQEFTDNVGFMGTRLVYWHASGNSICLSAWDDIAYPYSVPSVAVIGVNGTAESLPVLHWGDRNEPMGIQSFRLPELIPLDDRYCSVS